MQVIFLPRPFDLGIGAEFAAAAAVPVLHAGNLDAPDHALGIVPGFSQH